MRWCDPSRITDMAENWREACLERYGLTRQKSLATCQRLEGWKMLALQHPFYGSAGADYLGEHVTLEAGTGLVHTAPAHGLDDYVIGQK